MVSFNPLAFAKSFIYFIVGSIAMYILFGFTGGGLIKILLDICDTMALIPAEEWATVKPIVWAGVFIFSILTVIALPVWVYFEEDSQPLHGSIK